MRKIERQLGKIVDQCLLGNYTKSFSKRLSKRDVVEYEKSMVLDSCNHETNTTKSRLNSFHQRFAPQVGGIIQKNWTWYRWDRCVLTGEDKLWEFNGKHEFSVNY